MKHSACASYFRGRGRSPRRCGKAGCLTAKVRINKEFLGHNYVTDVITFENPSPINNKIYADIFVCFEQTKKQAKELGKPYRKEFLTVIIHGILHLIGYDDDTLKRRDEMNAVAENIASKFLRKIA